MKFEFGKTKNPIAMKLRTERTSKSSPARGVRIRSPNCEEMSGEVGKRGGGVRKKVNSENLEREREKRKIRRREKRFLKCAANSSEFVQNLGDSALATSTLSGERKNEPLGRIPPSVRADGSSILLFRKTLTDEWEGFRGPN